MPESADISRAALADQLVRFLAGELTADAFRDYLADCDAAIRAGGLERSLSGPVGALALALLEQAEGVRPEADMRSSLAAIAHTLAGDRAPRKPRARIPRPPARKPGPPPAGRRRRH